MPSSFPLFPLLAAGGLVLVGCDVSESKKPADPIPTNPTSIAVGQTISGNTRFVWSPHSDTLRLSFVADSGTTYSFRMGSRNGYVDGNILSADMTESDVDWATPAASGWSDSLVFPCLKGGTYQLLVMTTGYDPLLSSTVDFKVELTAKAGFASKYAAPDAYEPDDTKRTAKILVANGSVQARTIHGATLLPHDVDWIAIPCDSGKTYKVTHSTKDGRTSLSLFDPDSNALEPIDPTYADDLWTGPNSYSFAALRSGNYFVKIVSGGGPSSYSVSATSTRGLPAMMVPDAYEPDNFRNTARTISTDSTVQSRSIDGTAKYPTDVDWIAFAGTTGKTYTIHYTTTAQTLPAVALFSPDSTDLYASTTRGCVPNYGAGICTSTFTATQSGTFHIKVESYVNAVAYDIAVTSN
ncbi:MAG: hypothetical protein AAB214_20035 [Fibrobacterota bacterium]